MKSALLLFVLIFTTTLVFAQDDYVLEKDVPKVKRVFSGTPNPDFTNYALTASAYPLPKRDFRFSGTDIIFAKASYGLTNETTVSVNLSLIGTFIGAIKHNINIREGFDLAFSGSFGQALFIPEDTLAIIGGGDTVTQIGGGQVIATLGDHQNNLTGGIGVYYAKSNYEIIAGEEELFLNNVFIAGQKQLRNKIYLLAEGIYFWNYNTFTGSIAMKFIIKTRMSLLVGLMPIYRNGRIGPNRMDSDGGVIPMVSFRLTLDRH